MAAGSHCPKIPPYYSLFFLIIQYVRLLNHAEKEKSWEIENMISGASLISLGPTLLYTGSS